MLAAQGYAELRRHKLHISRARVMINLFTRAPAHSAAPPLPKKSVGLFGGPGMYCVHLKNTPFSS